MVLVLVVICAFCGGLMVAASEFFIPAEIFLWLIGGIVIVAVATLFVFGFLCQTWLLTRRERNQGPPIRNVEWQQYQDYGPRHAGWTLPDGLDRDDWYEVQKAAERRYFKGIMEGN